uniref:Nucleolar protein 10 n=1 Tax=Esox lucius TaxID=8010 RepID=A0A6Q2Y233_ESOLU
ALLLFYVLITRSFSTYKVDPLGQPTSSAHPKRFGLLLTQQPRPVL